VVCACSFLRPYLVGQEFLINTDHYSSRWLLNMNSAKERVSLWRLRLSDFRYKMCTTPGSELLCADAMSRLPTLAPVRAVIPEEDSCLVLADSFCDCVAPHSREIEKEHSVTLASMLSTQKDD